MDEFNNWTLEPEQINNAPEITSATFKDENDKFVTYAIVRDDSAIGYERVNLPEGPVWLEMAPF